MFRLRTLGLLFLFVLSVAAVGYTSTNVYLFQMKPVNGQFTLRNRVNIQAVAHNGAMKLPWCGQCEWHLGAKYDWFSTSIGIGDECPNSSAVAVFNIRCEKKELASERTEYGEAAKEISVPIRGYLRLCLSVNTGSENSDHCFWVAPQLVRASGGRIERVPLARALQQEEERSPLAVLDLPTSDL